jgi:hypothetical protein
MLTVNNMLILDVWWFVTGGVVLVQDQVTFEYKGYIKDFDTNLGPLPSMYDDKYITSEERDMINIASYGTKIPKASLQGFFPSVILDETKHAKETNPGYFL